MPSKLLEDYSRNYGSKLASALNGGSLVSALAPIPENEPTGEGVDTSDVYMPMGEPGTNDPDPNHRSPRSPGWENTYSQLDAGGGTDGSDYEEPMDPGMSSQIEPPEEGGLSFRKAFKEAPESVQKQQMSKLEETLKRGNQTIDSAYDDLVKQLGAPPDKNRKLSRKEKGMLLMEFGLKMLANSKKGLATAAGEAGSQTLNSYQDMKEGPVQQYNQSRSLIEAARASDKTKLATQSAIEGIKDRGSSASRLPGRFTGEDGNVYFYDEEGQIQQATDASGKPIKASKNDSGIRPNDFEVKRNAYMEVFGKDPNTGEKLTGLSLQRAMRDAVEFAGDRGSTLDDLDLDIQAERSADEEMKADAYRDMTPEQREAKRNEIAGSRRSRLRRPTRSYTPGTPEPRRGPPSAIVRKFATEADARAAFRRGEIKVGDTISVNGTTGPVE